MFRSIVLYWVIRLRAESLNSVSAAAQMPVSNVSLTPPRSLLLVHNQNYKACLHSPISTFISSTNSELYNDNNCDKVEMYFTPS